MLEIATPVEQENAIHGLAYMTNYTSRGFNKLATFLRCPKLEGVWGVQGRGDGSGILFRGHFIAFLRQAWVSKMMR